MRNFSTINKSTFCLTFVFRKASIRFLKILDRNAILGKCTAAIFSEIVDYTSTDLSPPQRLLFLKKPRKRGKGGKTGKAEKARKKGKSEESLCQISVEIWRPPGGWLCTAMPACWAVEQRILKMTFLNFNNPNK